ncbi:MAG: hypothetical protein AAF492_04675, partial [Verrucomicrobiota bacterium]
IGTGSGGIVINPILPDIGDDTGVSIDRGVAETNFLLRGILEAVSGDDAFGARPGGASFRPTRPVAFRPPPIFSRPIVIPGDIVDRVVDEITLPFQFDVERLRGDRSEPFFTTSVGPRAAAVEIDTEPVVGGLYDVKRAVSDSARDRAAQKGEEITIAAGSLAEQQRTTRAIERLNRNMELAAIASRKRRGPIVERTTQ